jgi:cell division protein ZapA (FtsZ GTPase activity inhibitor)
MYITIEKIRGEKTIFLSYPIQNFDSTKEIAIVSIFSDNVQYEIKTDLKITLRVDDSVEAEKQVPEGAYTSRELNAFLAGNVKLTPLGNNTRVIKTNKLANITALNFNLNILDNTDNLTDGRLSNTLMTFFPTDYGAVTNLEPKHPQYKKIKNGVFQSLTIKILDQNDKITTDTLGTSVVLHIR